MKTLKSSDTLYTLIQPCKCWTPMTVRASAGSRTVVVGRQCEHCGAYMASSRSEVRS